MAQVSLASSLYKETCKNLWISRSTRFLVQGLTGRQGSLHAQLCRDYGTKIVAGVNPNWSKSSSKQAPLNVPIYANCSQAVENCKADASLVFVPAKNAKDAVIDAIKAQLKLVVLITEGIPQWDMLEIKEALNSQNHTRLVGPNCPGLIRPGECKAGIMPGEVHSKGPIGVVSRSGTLTYEAVNQLTNNGIGQSLVVGIGGDPICGTDFIDVVEQFIEDEKTKGIVLIGEIGGSMEEKAAQFLHKHNPPQGSPGHKPVLAYIAGVSAPPGKRMGHAGAIISGSTGSASSKIESLTKSGVYVSKNVSSMGSDMKKILKKAGHSI